MIYLWIKIDLLVGGVYKHLVLIETRRITTINYRISYNRVLLDFGAKCGKYTDGARMRV